MKVIKPLIIFLFIGILLSFPVRALMADYYYNRVEHVLDDKSTDYLDVQPISADTMSNYINAIKYMENAAALVPSRSVYLKALSGIYSKLGRWAVNMESLKAQLPEKAVSGKEAFENAHKYIDKAISLEPTNPDYHLALGKLYDEKLSDSLLAEREFKKALLAYPVNAPLRYAVARHYLLTGRKGDALEQARILAGIDESYTFSDPESIEAKLMAERRTPAYLSKLYRSYLFGAFEIAWRVSEDKDVVKGMAPDNPDAREVVRLFLEWKGVEE